VRFIDGLRRYFISAKDSELKFPFSNCYGRLKSRNSCPMFYHAERLYKPHRLPHERAMSNMSETHTVP
jgi:hypothetical protein